MKWIRRGDGREGNAGIFPRHKNESRQSRSGEGGKEVLATYMCTYLTPDLRTRGRELEAGEVQGKHHDHTRR